MRFNKYLCYIKENRNHTKTEKYENCIIFNDSKVEFLDDITLNIDIKDREVFFVGSVEEVKELEKKKTIVNWVEFFDMGSYTFELPEGANDVLFITKSIYEELKISGLTSEEIYKMIKEIGFGEIPKELPKVSDFCVLKARISE